MVYLSLIRYYNNKHVCVCENRKVFGSKEKVDKYQKDNLLDRLKSENCSWSAENPNIVQYSDGDYVTYTIEHHEIQ